MRIPALVMMGPFVLLSLAGGSLSCRPGGGTGVPGLTDDAAIARDVARADPHDDEELHTLARWMTGAFSSQAQAASDTTYFDIRLEMWPMWAQRDDGVWLYVEQAVAGHEQEPYRQRVYHVERVDEKHLRSVVYTLPDPDAVVGAWKRERPLAHLTPDDLILREGCAIVLHRANPLSFVGSTRGRACGSDLRGASYATSEVTVRPDRLVSWDRGFDEEGRQVWGAVAGGYVFDKMHGGRR